ncbi:hypothetical protein HYT74_00875 [Candidatus Daviesbacteria bacterium]|nr:hypothetical protein [Candidatus Daviesbacteria bacterium]
MNKGIYKLILAGFFSVALFFIFSLLEFELLNEGSSKNIQSIIFAITAAASVFYPKIRNKLMYISFVPLLLMIIFYLFGNLRLANSVGSLGLGMLSIVIFSYIIKKL